MLRNPLASRPPQSGALSHPQLCETELGDDSQLQQAERPALDEIDEIPSSPASRSEASLSTRCSWNHRYGEISIDVIPDITPIVGYIDDVGAATAAYIWDEHVARAEEQLSPNITDNSLNDAQATAPTSAQPSQQPVSSTARSRTSGTA